MMKLALKQRVRNAIPRHSVNLARESFFILISVIKSGKILDGSFIKLFEDKFANYIGSTRAATISSARDGLFLTLKVLNLQKDDEIIVPAYTFHIMPLIIKLSDVRPIFVDVQPNTYNINPDLIEAKITDKTKAILITHMFGQSCEMDSILKICKKYNLKLIEDCAHACGAEYKGKKVGSFGDVGLFSFGLGKNLPCFGGGALTINNEHLYRKMSTLLSEYLYPSKLQITKIIITGLLTYFLTRRWVFTLVVFPVIYLVSMINSNLLDNKIEEKGKILSERDILRTKFRFTNAQAAIGLKQLERLDYINEIMRRNAQIYTQYLEKIEKIKILSTNPFAKHVYTYYYIEVEEKDRDSIRKRLLRTGIDTQLGDNSDCAALPLFNGSGDDCPVAKKIDKKTIELPNNVFLKEKEIIYILEQLKQVISI